MLRASVLCGCLVLAATAASAQDTNLSFDGLIGFYGDNTEFTNPFSEGRTILGTYALAFVEARTSPKLALRAGVFGNQRFGSDEGFDEVRPVLAIVVGNPQSRLILGTLETSRRVDGAGPDRAGPHGLLPPLQRETLAFERRWEAGMQWLVNVPRLTQEAWVNWQTLATSDQREVFDTGFKARFNVRPALAVRGELLFVHQGGQLSSVGVVADSLAGALGAELGGPAGPFNRVSFEAYVLGSHFVPSREDSRLVRSGFATFLRASAEKSGWRGHGILWRGDDFITREGDPNYQSIRRDATTYRGLRDYAELGLTRTFALAPHSWLEASARWHRVENDYEYSFRIVAVARLLVD